MPLVQYVGLPLASCRGAVHSSEACAADLNGTKRPAHMNTIAGMRMDAPHESIKQFRLTTRASAARPCGGRREPVLEDTSRRPTRSGPGQQQALVRQLSGGAQ